MEFVHNSSARPSGSSSEQGISCHQLHASKRTLFAALTDGRIAVWRRRADVAQGHVDSRPQLLAGHTGAVTCLLLAEQEGLGLEGHLLLSGGADRTIRVWDPAIKDASKACVQTLRGHGGTVSSLAYCDGVLVSTSTDRTIQVRKRTAACALRRRTLQRRHPNPWP